MPDNLKSSFAQFPGISDDDAQDAFVLDGLWVSIEQQFGIDIEHAPDWPGASEFLHEIGLDTEQLATLSCLACSYAAMAYRLGREHGARGAGH